MHKIMAITLCALSAAMAAAPDQTAIAEVAAGKRTTANAAWWGFSKDDSTAALQAAIDSGAKTVVVPYMGEAWIVRPIKLRGNLELLFEPGVLVLAKRGEFQGGGDSLFTAVDAENLTIRGYGATLRMWKTRLSEAALQESRVAHGHRHSRLPQRAHRRRARRIERRRRLLRRWRWRAQMERERHHPQFGRARQSSPGVERHQRRKPAGRKLRVLGDQRHAARSRHRSGARRAQSAPGELRHPQLGVRKQ